MSVGLIVGAGGIGSEVARMTSESVDHVVVFDRDPDRVQRLTGEIGSVGVTGDIASEASRHTLTGELGRLGHALKWVVLSSGVGLHADITRVSPDVLRSAFEVNVVAPILLVSELLREAQWAEEPRIVGVGSISARRASRAAVPTAPPRLPSKPS